MWQRRFDSELDVDLLDETELYDPNNISSMLKAWLRDLPTEIMPKKLQKELAVEIEKEDPDYKNVGRPAPQILRDALSDLPPFNYYLLFAITCHLSLLVSHSEKNKMDLNNLSICIGQTLDLERWLFNYLVGDWRHCWQGCFTEKQYLEAERAHEEGREYTLPPTITRPQAKEVESNGTTAQSQTQLQQLQSQSLSVENERAVHSSGSNASGDVSRTGSGSAYEDARSTHEGSPNRANNNTSENKKPNTYQPAGYSQSSTANAKSNTAPAAVATPERKPVGSTSSDKEGKRPATAGKQSEGESKKKDASKLGGGAHSRSHSELPLAEIKPGSPMDFPSYLRTS